MRLAVACVGLALALAVACRGAPPERESPSDLPAVRRAVISAPRDPPRTIAYWSNANLSGATGRTHAVIIIHGDQRNAAEYFAFARSAARIAGSDAILIAPRFVTTNDRGREATDVTWSDDDWKSGDTSGRHAVSSFAVVDRLIADLAARDPALTEVVVAGHSAGGQFVQRYAAAARIPAGLAARFVVANPSSYLYLDDRRPEGGAFDEPSSRAVRSCARYDRYKYGLEDLPPHLDEIGADTLREQYRARDVTILLGALDQGDDTNLDRGCEARLQGAQRYERGAQFYQYVQTLFPPAGRHVLEVVAAVGHDGEGMLTSDEGRRALFGAASVQAR
jgi:pimeloyl-ACP methyl ester carboxylesterase